LATLFIKNLLYQLRYFLAALKTSIVRFHFDFGSNQKPVTIEGLETFPFEHLGHALLSVLAIFQATQVALWVQKAMPAIARAFAIVFPEFHRPVTIRTSYVKNIV
jgi:hypothetical protein